MTDDEKTSQRYRELPREEPPRHLDDAILAAARRAANTRPAPLVVPSGRQRWYFPLAAAAIIVLAVAVTMHMEREQTPEEIASAPATAPEATMRDQAQSETRGKPMGAPQPERKRRAEPDDVGDLRAKRETAPAEVPKAAAPTPAQDPVAAIAQSPEPAPAQSAAELARAEEARRAASSASAYAVQSPEQWLQGIADLRRQGWHEEADRQLAEFRKRYPDYKIPEPMLKRVERPR